MENKEKINEAIVLLEQCKVDLGPLLEGIPSLSIRMNTTFDRLINGMKVMNGQNVAVAAPETVDGGGKLRHVLGRPIHETPKARATKPGKDEVDQLRETAKTLYATFLDRDNKEILDAVSDIELRAVAKLAGMTDVTASVPAKLGSKFVDEVKAAIKAKEDLKKEQAIVKKKEGRVKHLTNLKFVHDEKAKTYTFETVIVKDDELLDDERFAKLDDEVKAAIKAKK